MSRHDDVNKRMAHSNPQEDHFIYYLNLRFCMQEAFHGEPTFEGEV